MSINFRVECCTTPAAVTVSPCYCITRQYTMTAPNLKNWRKINLIWRSCNFAKATNLVICISLLAPVPADGFESNSLWHRPCPFVVDDYRPIAALLREIQSDEMGYAAVGIGWIFNVTCSQSFFFKGNIPSFWNMNQTISSMQQPCPSSCCYWKNYRAACENVTRPRRRCCWE